MITELNIIIAIIAVPTTQICRIKINSSSRFVVFVFDHQLSTAMETSRQGEDVTDVVQTRSGSKQF